MWSKKILKNRLEIESIIVFVLILFSCLQSLSIVEFGGFALKPIHVILLLLLPKLLLKGKVYINGYVSLYVLYVVFLSILLSGNLGIKSILFNYIFGLLIYVYIVNSNINLLPKEDTIHDICNAAFLVIVVVLINDLIQYKEFITFFHNPWNGHPSITTIFGGGVNPEASWIGMFNVFFLKDKRKWSYFFISLLISVIYASRAGMIINIVALVMINKDSVFKDKKTIVFAVIGIIGIIWAYNNGLLDIITDRFSTLGSDKGSEGRLINYQGFIKTFEAFPLGYGIGNCMDAMRMVAGSVSGDNNMHNVYLQNFIDIGIIGGIWYIILVLFFVKTNIFRLFTDPFVMYIFIYIVVSLFEFRGGDTLVFIILGFYTLYRRKNKFSNSSV